MHVVAYTDATGRGGGEHSLGHLVGALDESIRVTVVGVDPDVVDWVAGRRRQAVPYLLPMVRGPWDLPRMLAHLRMVFALRPDVLHANLRVPWSCWYGLLGGVLRPGTATVAVEQLPIPTTSAPQRWWKRRLSRWIDAHVAVGEASARRTEQVVGLRAGSVRSIPNYVPDPGPVEREPHEGVALVGVGRLDPQKGFDILLEALRQVPELRLTLVGEGGQRAELERQAAEGGLSGRVTLEGWSDDVRGHLARADALVLPSRSEGFPLIVVEAMLAGLPVVATRVGSVPEAVRDGETGLLVEPGDAAALAGALRKLADDEDLRRALGTRGRDVAAGAFTVEHMAQAYQRLYDAIGRPGKHG